ncbi:MAG: hypothetical protein VX852_02905 [Candidatus Neomarinimicrobiota bacterium]|nr:hypothetical protein [Candidatus Neomarinimicrobiota bacterium]
MKLQKSVYLLSFLLLIIFTADLHGQFRRKKVKLSETNKIEEFINDHIQDPFMVEHIQAIQSELVKIGFEILPPETNGELTVEIMFEDFSFDPYYGSTANPRQSHIIFRDPKTTRVVAKFMANSILQDDDFDGPMTNAFGNTTNSSMSGGYGGTADQPVDVNAIIVDWMKQIKNFY